MYAQCTQQRETSYTDKFMNAERLICMSRFRWVACQVDYLCELPNDRARREALKSLPPTLSSTYEHLLQRVNESNPHNQRVVQRTIMWLIYGMRMSSSALCEAISINLGDEDLDEESVPSKADILRCCSSLIRLTHGAFELAHFTVKEFFLGLQPSSRPELMPYYMEEKSSILEMARICFTYLNFRRFGNGSVATLDEYRALNDANAFKLHCSLHWERYWQSQWSDEISRSLVQKLFDPKNLQNFSSLKQQRFWITITGLSADSALPSAWHERFSSVTALLVTLGPLHYAAMMREHELCSWILNSGCSVTQSSELGTPLHLAIAGADALCEVSNHIISGKPIRSLRPAPLPQLSGLRRQTSVPSPPPPPLPPLHDGMRMNPKYCKFKEACTFKELINAGADPYAKSGSYECSALHMAAGKVTQILLSLLETGVRIDEGTLKILANKVKRLSLPLAALSEILNAIDPRSLEGPARAVFMQLSLKTGVSISHAERMTEIASNFPWGTKEH